MPSSLPAAPAWASCSCGVSPWPACSCFSSASSGAPTREVVHNSQVAVLVDVSQSMGLGESENASGHRRSRESRRSSKRWPTARSLPICVRRTMSTSPVRPGGRAGRDRCRREQMVESRGSRVESQKRASHPISLLRPSTLDPRPSTPSTGPPSCNPAARKRGSARRSPTSCGYTATRRWPA